MKTAVLLVILVTGQWGVFEQKMGAPVLEDRTHTSTIVQGAATLGAAVQACAAFKRAYQQSIAKKVVTITCLAHVVDLEQTAPIPLP